VKDLRQITVVGMGLLGASICLAAQNAFDSVKVVGFSHRVSTRKKAGNLCGETIIVDDLCESVIDSDIVIVATPIFTFKEIFKNIKNHLKKGAVVTDVGSTKVTPHKWAAKYFDKNVYYVGSHPIAGSEQRGVEYARDDLFDNCDCIITSTKSSNKNAVSLLKYFWVQIGCRIVSMSPSKHDKIFGYVSHLPHITATALVNANSQEFLKYSGKGFIDTSRIASGPANIWTDIFMSNSKNCAKGIESLICQLERIKKVIEDGNYEKTKKLLEQAGNKRAKLINYKLRKRELIP
jgi:prephenate dehydrogenase